jgi:hypothetical protein
MKKVIAIFTILPFVTVGCLENKRSTDEFVTVDVTANYPQKELILQDFMDVEYIPLETNDEFLTMAHTQAVGRDIIIVRNVNRDGDIFIFDRKNGKGLRKINRRGQSGEEYTNVHNIILDEDNDEMYINSTFTDKILLYDLFGNFKQSFNCMDGIDLIGNLDRDNFICHDNYFDYDRETVTVIDKKRNCFLIVSKLDESIKEIPIPYKEKIPLEILQTDANGRLTDKGIHNKTLIPYREKWILTEPSADTIYSYSPDQTMKPFIARTPSVQSMNPAVFLFPGVLTDRYYFMQTIKKQYNFVTDEGFPTTELMYDKEENAIFECVVYNDDFTNKKPVNLVYEYPMFTLVNNNEIAVMKKLEANELVEAYKEGKLKEGRLKEIAAGLDEESNPVIMLIKYKK